MTQPPKIPSITEAYAATPPNELEQRLVEQKAHPSAQEYEWAIVHMPRTDPRKQAVIRAQINHEPVDYEKIWKEHTPS